jgi:hypothetical protein
VWLVLGGIVLAIGGNQVGVPAADKSNSPAPLDHQLAQLRSFSAAKLKQSQELAQNAGEQISPEFQTFFEAATKGDSQTVTNMYADFHRRHPQYSRGTNATDIHLSTAYWSPVLEICLAYDQVVNCEPKYTAMLADGIVNAIPPGSIYFGGTDPGRGVPTAFSKSHADGDPFFTLTQNALADGSYLKYLRDMYGGEIHTLTDNDSQRCFGEYTADLMRRFEHDRQWPSEPKQMRPGENVRTEGGQTGISGQAAVMSINALLAKVVFEQNSNKEFFIEESFPLEWMYPRLEPFGLIMKIDRQPLAELPEDTLIQDHAYWQNLVAGMLGDWLNPDTPVSAVADFIEKIYVRKDLGGFTGDAAFVQNDYAKRIFSKLRSSLAGVYAWRVAHAAGTADKQRMAAEADFAFRQAFALCPYSPEAVFRYATLLTNAHRIDDALLVATSAAKVDPKNSEIQTLIKNLKSSASAK